MLYKNALMVLPQFWYNFYTQDSGQPFYLDFPFYLPNAVVYTFLPAVIYGILEQDVDGETAVAFPELYKDGVKKRFFNRV